MAAGANGAILASANLIADIWQEIYQLIKRGDLAAAQNLQAKIKKLIRIVVRSGPTQAVKEGLQMMGLKMSNSRLPDVLSGMRLKLKSRARRHRRNVKSCTGKTIQD